MTSANPKYPARFSLLAACMMHEEGFYSTKSLAFRDKNPGNLRGADGKFRVYGAIQDGYNALLADIAANTGSTLKAFIAKYAPPNENNTSLYLQVVSTLSGIQPEETI